MRIKLGIGTFIVALLTPSNGKSAEQEIFYGLFMQELHLLNNGILATTTDKHVYRGLQLDSQASYACIYAELCVHSYDTKALQKVLNVHGPGSRTGCPLCKEIKGQYRAPLKKIVHLGHRYGYIELCTGFTHTIT